MKGRGRDLKGSEFSLERDREESIYLPDGTAEREVVRESRLGREVQGVN